MNEHDGSQGTGSRGGSPAPGVLTVVRGRSPREFVHKTRPHPDDPPASCARKYLDIFIVLDAEGCILRWNGALNQLTGLKDDQLLGQDFPLLLPRQESARVRQAIQFVRDRGTVTLQTLMREKDGSGRSYEMTVDLLKNPESSGSSVCIMAKDLSGEGYSVKMLPQEGRFPSRHDPLTQEIMERNRDLGSRVEKQASEIESLHRELKDFTYAVSHDLRAPLRSINQLASWIWEDYANCLDDAGKEQMTLLVGRAKRMENLLQAVLQYSRIGRIREEPRLIDSADLVREAIALVAPGKNIRMVVEPDLPGVVAKPTLLRQVFQCLIDNAVKFMDKPEGEIGIGCSDQGDYWEFRVYDNGPGIDEKYHERIFQIFHTLMPRDRMESTGIGLTLVQKIAEMTGGTVRVTSRVGQGATFHFTLPKGTPP